MPGRGTSARQASGRAAVAGTTSCTGLGITPKDTEKTNPSAAGAALPCSDAAQQLSASAWLAARGELESWESDVCIGHAPPSEQQAIRAPGVATQPAHTATWLAETARVNRSADTRLVKISTSVGCWSEAEVSNARLRSCSRQQRCALDARGCYWNCCSARKPTRNCLTVIAFNLTRAPRNARVRFGAARRVRTNIGIFALAAAFEIAGCFAFWLWIRRGAALYVAVLGMASLVGFAVALTRVDSAFAGRTPRTAESTSLRR